MKHNIINLLCFLIIYLAAQKVLFDFGWGPSKGKCEILLGDNNSLILVVFCRLIGYSNVGEIESRGFVAINGVKSPKTPGNRKQALS